MVSCYPQDGKQKSYDICKAFADGCGGQVVTDGIWRQGPSMFYGISDSNESVWKAARKADCPWYYADNAFFDAVRGTYFRVGVNRLQHPGTGTSDGKRFAALGLTIEPWRYSGDHILVCPQSDHFMRVAADYDGSWASDTVAELERWTDRPIRVRPWNRNKKLLALRLPAALAHCWAVVVYSSGSGITALLSGIPIVATASESVMAPMSGYLDIIDVPSRPPGRQKWANIVADQQWTLDEMRSGQCWAALS